MNEFINIGWTKDEIAKKIANEFPHGSYVNLGIGMPELVSKFVDESKEIIYHSENGLLGTVSYTHLTLPTSAIV